MHCLSITCCLGACYNLEAITCELTSYRFVKWQVNFVLNVALKDYTHLHVSAQYLCCMNSEAVLQRYSTKIAVLKILENFQEKTYGCTL